ncbi:MAG: hypothetical protein II027_02035, partial [Bacteroidales bacterium]|nr:hypothetical protein [Bacteroidales bacterium]
LVFIFLCVLSYEVIPQVITYTRYGTGSVVMFDYAESHLCTIGRFRINELTSNVPFAVRSVLRNDYKNIIPLQ